VTFALKKLEYKLEYRKELTIFESSVLQEAPLDSSLNEKKEKKFFMPEIKQK
jgi:hypothetical protein